MARTVSRLGKRPAQDKVLESKFERIEMNSPNSRAAPSALTGGNTVCIHIMPQNDKALLSRLKEQKVEFVIIGGVCGVLHGASLVPLLSY